MSMKYDEEKFAELILYVASKSEDDMWFGATKLNKLVFYAEFEAYRELGRPISGAVFQNLENGPAPKRLLPVQRHLVDFGAARLEMSQTPTGVQKRLVAIREPDLSGFSEAELAIVDRVIARCWGKTARQVSDESHEEPGWIVTSESEAIPYHMALLSRPEPTPEDVRFVRKLAENGRLPDHP